MNEQPRQETTEGKGLAIAAGVGLVLMAIGLGALWYFQDNIRRAFEGPTPVAAEDLAKLDNLEHLPSPWVVFTAKKVVPTTVEVVRIKAGSKRVESKYYLLQVGDRWLVAALSPKFWGHVVQGELAGPGHALWTDAWNKVTAETTAIHQGRLVPFQLFGYLDYGENWKYGLYFFVGLAGFGLLLVVIALWQSLAGRWFPGKEAAPPSAEPARVANLDRAWSGPK